MTPETWKKVAAAFDELAELDPREQASVLEQMRSEDPVACRQLERLLKERERRGFSEQAPRRVLVRAAREIAVQDHPHQSNTGEVLSDAFASTASEHANTDLPTTAPSQLGFLSPPQEEGEIGRLGSYRVLSVLGAGGMGVVLEAEDLKLHRRVALKVMKPELATNQQYHERFLREARAAAAVENDNIVPIYEVGADRGVPFLAMPLLKGRSLDDYINEGRKLSLHSVLRIGRQVAEGLSAAHEEGLIHRDIKPSNIWIEPVSGGRAKIVDFGLARALRPQAATQLTHSGVLLGTPAYMSPEQSRSPNVDHRCDLFSLGSVLYQLLTGELPFKGEDVMSLLAALAADNPRPPCEIDKSIPEDVSLLVMQLLSKDPSARPATALAVVDAIRGIEKRLATTAPPVSSPPPKQPSVSHHDTSRSSNAQRYSRSSWRRICLVGGALLGLGALVFALMQIILVRTPQGTVIVKSFDPNMHITITRNGTKVDDYVLSKRASTITLRTGQIEVRVKGKTDGIRVMNGKFMLERGKEVIVEITRDVAGDPRPKLAKKELQSPKRTAKDEPKETAKWVSLFNGKDLNGWTTFDGKPGPWRVENGMLIGEGKDLHHLYSTRGDYTNFQFRVEAKISAGNSGQWFRAKLNPKFPPGYEAQIVRPSPDAKIFEKTGVLYICVPQRAPHPFVAVEKTFEPPAADAWFIQEVIARGNHIVIKVNGDKVVDYVDDNDTFSNGHFALQIHPAGGTGSVVYFKKIEVKELPTEKDGRHSPVAPRPKSKKATQLNYALQFKGNGYAKHPNFFPLNGPLTVEAWVKFHDRSPNSVPIAHTGRGSPLMFAAKWNGNLWAFEVRQKKIGRSASQLDNRYQIGDFMHVACTWNGKEVALFVNGIRQRTANRKPKGQGHGPGGGLRIGTWVKGVIDDVRVSRGVRYTDYQFTPAPRLETDDDTIALYHFDEGKGNIAKDCSGNNRHLSITNGQWVLLEKTEIGRSSSR